MNHSMRLARSVTLAGPSRYIYRSFSASRIICNAAPLTQSKLEFAMREGLKSAMKARDKPAVALHKVSAEMVFEAGLIMNAFSSTNKLLSGHTRRRHQRS